MKRLLLVTVLVGLLAIPSMAEGWFVEMGNWYAKPSNGQTFGQYVDDSGSMEHHYPVEFDMGHDWTWELGFGYDTGDFGAFSVNYWNGYEDTWSYYTEGAGSDWWFEPSGPNYDDLYHIFTTRAWQVDLKWSNTFGGDGKWSGEYYTGLRYFDYELAAYKEAYNSSSDYFRMYWDDDVYGLGFSGGLSGIFSFTDRLYLHGGMDIAFLAGNREVNVYKRDDSGGCFDDEMTYNDEIFTHFNVDFGFKFFIYEGLYGDFGYRYASWIDTATQIEFKGGPNENDFDKTEDVNWEGFYLNLGWDFGK